MASKILLDRLVYVHYQHTNLTNAHNFMVDFGLVPVKETDTKVYYRGFGKDQFCCINEKSPDNKRHFVTGGFAVQTRDDLEKAAKLPGASPITTADWLGGGETVTVKDPAGMNLTLIYGQTERKVDSSDIPETEVFNDWDKKPRKGEPQRFEQRPSRVHKLGHYGFAVPEPDHAKTMSFYLDNFNLAITDNLYNKETGADIMTFIHLDKGKEFVDHHSFFIANGGTKEACNVHHSSFEVDNWDSQIIGHYWLEKKGWTNCWGIGRHLLGSQIFDYWFDPSSNVIEHYADGDMVNCDTEVTQAPAELDSIAIWGPNVPIAFMTRRMEDLSKGFVQPGTHGPPEENATKPENLSTQAKLDLAATAA